MPVFVFVGNDELRKQEALDADLHRWELSEPEIPPVRVNFFGEDLSAGEVAESYESPDLFAPRKSIVIRNFDKVNAEGIKLLEKAFKSENSQVAVFITAGKMDGRSSWPKSLKEAGKLQEFKLPYDNQIPSWLATRAKQHYQRILGMAEARLLHDIVGGETSELDHELEKLDTFLPKGQAITTESIETLVSPLKVFAIFAFQKAMGFGQKQDLLPALRNLQYQGFEGFQLVLRIFSHFLTLAKIRSLLDDGASDHEIEEVCKLNHFIHIVKEKYLDQARTRSMSRWRQLLAHLARMEWEMKQGRLLHRFELEMAFARMLR